MLNTQTAQAALTLHANNNFITVQQVEQLLANVSVTFANITSVTKVTTAAAHKGVNIVKVTNANVILCSNIKAHTSVYANKVKRSAAAIKTNNTQDVANFTAQENYFFHTNCYSIVQHKTDAAKHYLYCIYNNTQSLYYINGVLSTKQQVAQYLTPSAAHTLLNASDTVYNVKHDIEHKVHVRTIALGNIVAIKARKQLLLK